MPCESLGKTKDNKAMLEPSLANRPTAHLHYQDFALAFIDKSGSYAV